MDLKMAIYHPNQRLLVDEHESSLLEKAYSALLRARWPRFASSEPQERKPLW